MRVCLLGAANVVHTLRWANGLAERGIDVSLVSCHVLDGELDSRVDFHALPFKAPFGYVASAIALTRLLKAIKPDVLNTHYATGYGLLARLSGFQPDLLSVWGSDVYDFPEKSWLHRWVLKGNLKAAAAIASTSRCMARKTQQTYAHGKVFITPFGIDEELFSPEQQAHTYVERPLVLGTVKTLARKYGIDTLIEAFAIARQQLGSNIPLLLEITGGGPDLVAMQALAQRLGVADSVVFHGAVAHSRVAEMLNRLDIYLALSRLDSESFGVAILEASACEKPVVVSDADGPREVTLDGVTGFVVPRNDPAAAAAAVIKLAIDADLRRCMGEAGRAHVLAHYTWSRSVDLMLDAYRDTVSDYQQHLR